MKNKYLLAGLPLVVAVSLSAFLHLVVTPVVQGSGIIVPAYQRIQQAGTNLTQRPTVNFSGTITCVDDAVNNRTNCPAAGGGGTGYDTIEVAGVALTQRTILNFPSNMSCVDNAGALRTDCTPSGGGGGGVFVGTFAALPACAGSSFVYSVIASPLVGYCDGSAYNWRAWGVSVPNLVSTSTFTFVSPSATWSDSAAGVLHVEGGPTGGLGVLQYGQLAVPAAPWTATVYYNYDQINAAAGASLMAGGLIVEDTSTGHLNTWFTQSAGGSPGPSDLVGAQWSAPNTPVAAFSQIFTVATPSVVAMRVSLDAGSTTLTYSYSLDGGVSFRAAGTQPVGGGNFMTTVSNVGPVFINVNTNPTAGASFFALGVTTP